MEREGDGVRTPLRTVDLLESGLLDSLDLVTLSILLEKHTGRRLDISSEQTLEAMRRFADLVALARKL